jgi:hypothetical protein
MMPKATKPLETIDPANPEITMGQRPDGSPWVISVDFGYGISASDSWGIRDNRKQVDSATARGRAAALLAAAKWIDTNKSQKFEAQATEV